MFLGGACWLKTLLKWHSLGSYFILLICQQDTGLAAGVLFFIILGRDINVLTLQDSMVPVCLLLYLPLLKTFSKAKVSDIHGVEEGRCLPALPLSPS